MGADSSAAARVLRALRPHPHRGDIVAAGALSLVVAVLLLQVRFEGPWGDVPLLFLALLPGAVVYGMGLASELEDERAGPRAYQSVLLLGGIALLAVAVLRLAEAFGVDQPLEPAGTRVWTFTVIAGLAARPAWWLRSPICLLVQLLATLVSILAFADWALGVDDSGIRWVLFTLALAFLLGHLVQRERRRPHAVQFAVAAGIAVVLIGSWPLGLGWAAYDDSSDAAGLGAWWILVLLAAGFGLIAYSGVDGERGPGYIGALVLLLFLVEARSGDSVLWWPLVLLALAGAGLGIGLRPRRELPPEPIFPPPDPPRIERARPTVIETPDDQGLR